MIPVTLQSLTRVRQLIARSPLVFLMALAMVALIPNPAWSQSVNDVIFLESNSTASNSILAFRNTGNGSPTFLTAAPAGGIGVYDGTFALGPFDSDQNLIINPEGTLLFAVNSGSNSIAVYDLTDPLEPVEIQHFVLAETTGALFSSVIDDSDQWIYVSNEQSSATVTPAANAFHSLKVGSDGTLTEPFPPTVVPIGGTVPVRAQGIA